MKIRKHDNVLIREAEENGQVVSMTNIVMLNRTPLNEKLSAYFKEKVPNYSGTFDEDECEDILFRLNEYLKEKKIKKFKSSIEFPYDKGSEVYLIPITDRL